MFSHQKFIRKQCLKQLFADINKTDVKKSNSPNCNSTFNVFSAFYTQAFGLVLKTLKIFSVHLREMHYVFHESITSAILQHFTSNTCQNSSLIFNNWSLYLCEEYLKTRTVNIFLRSKYFYSVSYY